jgi:hypothetical protein
MVPPKHDFVPSSYPIPGLLTPPASPSMRASGKKVYPTDFLLKFQTVSDNLFLVDFFNNE